MRYYWCSNNDREIQKGVKDIIYIKDFGGHKSKSSVFPAKAKLIDLERALTVSGCGCNASVG